jgi:hypothetical protein
LQKNLFTSGIFHLNWQKKVWKWENFLIKTKKNIEHLICMSFEMILSITEENDKPMYRCCFFFVLLLDSLLWKSWTQTDERNRCSVQIKVDSFIYIWKPIIDFSNPFSHVSNTTGSFHPKNMFKSQDNIQQNNHV